MLRVVIQKLTKVGILKLKLTNKKSISYTNLLLQSALFIYVCWTKELVIKMLKRLSYFHFFGYIGENECMEGDSLIH